MPKVFFVATLLIGMQIFGVGEAAAQFDERKRVRIPPMSESSPPPMSESGSQRPIDPRMIPNTIEFSPDAQLSRRMALLEERIDHLMQQNAGLNEQLSAANAGISRLEDNVTIVQKQMRSPDGRTMINLITSIWAKVGGL